MRSIATSCFLLLLACGCVSEEEPGQQWEHESGSYFARSCLAQSPQITTGDQIENVIINLPDGWKDDVTGPIILPKTASTEDVLPKVFEQWLFPDSQMTNYSRITNFKVLETRQVSIPRFHFTGAPVYSYTAVLVQTNLGEKIVLLRCFDVYTSRAWLSSEVFDVKPSRQATATAPSVLSEP